MAADPPPSARSDFIREVIEDDLRTGSHRGRVLTRFPPEPNGYLHIGHAKSICLNFGIAEQYATRCHLRFDDTNPEKEDVEYVDSIEADVAWLGFSFGAAALYASDYFPEMYELACDLIRAGEAYVDHSSDEEIKALRGTLSEPGRPSPWRDRAADENLALFAEMRSGALPDGTCVLRARIDLTAANMKMRDPLLYRIRHATHHRTGDDWCIYPMYDWAHPLSDAIEGITHSICTLEFENNRPLYDWVVEHTRVSERHGFSRPHQYEFARLNLDFTVLSKRRLLTLVTDGHVSGWDDPRMPTIAGMRRRGYRPEAIRAFCDRIGVAKANSTVDLAKLEHAVRDDLNTCAPRALGVLRPLPVEIETWPDGEVETLIAPCFPPDVGRPGERPVPFGRRILIDRDDFEFFPPAGYQRLGPGRTVRLRHGPLITCTDVITGADGEVTGLRARHVPRSVGVNPEGIQVWGVIHWVSADHAVPAEVRLYDRLFSVARPDDGDGDLAFNLNPDSLLVMPGAMVEPSLAGAAPGSRWQLERVGYFALDPVDSRPGALVLNRIVTLRDSWAASAAPEAAAGEGRAAERARTSSSSAATGPLVVGARAASAKAKTRPPKRSRAEYRAEARVRDPELAARFALWPAAFSISESDADLLTGDRATGDLFTAAVTAGAPAPAVARWIVNDLPPELGDRSIDAIPMSGAALAALVRLAEDGTISGPVAKDVFAEMMRTGAEPGEVIAARGLTQVSDEAAVAAVVDEVLAAHPDKVAAYRDGKTALLGFFVGQSVRASGGTANPKVVQQVLAERLG